MKLNERSLTKMEELKRFQGSTFDTISRRKVIEDRDTILELTGKIQELQNEINCTDVSSDFQDAESERSGHSHVTSQPVFFPPHPVPGGMPSRSKGMTSCRERPPSIWDTHGISGYVLLKGGEEWKPKTPVQDQRCQSGQSAKNSVILRE